MDGTMSLLRRLEHVCRTCCGDRHTSCFQEEELKRCETCQTRRCRASGASRSSSGISELDRVLGGGIMQGSAILIGGEPGIGKSTLMLQLLSSASITSSLYISGEESPVQIKLRAERLRLPLGQIELLHDTNLEHIEQLLRHKRPQLVIIDSIQTLFSEQLGPIPGLRIRSSIPVWN